MNGRLRFHFVLALLLAFAITAYSHPKIKKVQKRLLNLDKTLTILEPATSKLPIVNKGIPPLSSLLENIKSARAEVLYVGALGYIASVEHYMASSSALPSCVFRPAITNDVVLALQIIDQERIEFSVNSGKHTGNPGFSSTKGGLQIDMRRFSQVTLSQDRTYVDIGPGNVWDNVYAVLQGTGRMVKGGRVSGVGVGGLMTGGGGYSFFTQKYGMATDSLISIDIVLPNATHVTTSAESDPDLFWAVKGGGNQFGIVTNFRVKTFAVPSVVWGGTRLYTGHEEDFKQYTLNIAQNLTDRNASASIEFIYYAKTPIFAIQAYYDDAESPAGTFDSGLPPKALLQPLLDTWGPNNMKDIVTSSPSNLTIGLRGCFNVASLHYYSKTILDVAINEIDKLNADLLHSGFYFHVAIEPAGHNYGAYADPTNSSPFPYYKSPQSLLFYFGWVSELDDEFYFQAIKNAVQLVEDQARSEGQNVDNLEVYPNYSIFDTPPEKLFGDTNLARLQEIKKKYDPNGIMRLTTSFAF
ncbi:FAD-binding domain-containing protein [Meira miltonrushii]|uniref:FAD-binding domain-containing protein n=1 Tax=Meira miltonrushii TaxID=1280837 RepID=A0A316VHB1_9BASI|nr:FAD-binding domain-containing protein [Meira miltonrushii]PWN37047.1 FAD-binding domain-containing protein [Meira miltonrushii]